MQKLLLNTPKFLFFTGKGADTVIRVIAGLILLTAGFYFLIKF